MHQILETFVSGAPQNSVSSGRPHEPNPAQIGQLVHSDWEKIPGPGPGVLGSFLLLGVLGLIPVPGHPEFPGMARRAGVPSGEARRVILRELEIRLILGPRKSAI